MPFELAASLYEFARAVVGHAVARKVSYTTESFFVRRKIDSRLDDSVAKVTEQLLPLFKSEHLTEQRQKLLIDVCRDELSAVVQDPKELFAASLDGQKLFDQRYAECGLPQAIRDEDLDDAYARLFPSIANLICAFPPAIAQWKIEGFRDGFRRLDELAQTLGNVANNLEQLVAQDSQRADALRTRLRQSLFQRVQFQMDLTGLRGDRPDAVPLERCFIVPEVFANLVDYAGRKRLNKATRQEQILKLFRPACRITLIGPPGAGKSTFSLWLQRLKLSTEKGDLAILVKLRELLQRPTLPAFSQIVRDAGGTHLQEQIDSNAITRWTQEQRLLLILDGFDEVPLDRRDETLFWIRDLATVEQDAGVVLTSRPLTTAHLDELEWTPWTIASFDENRVAEYISRWYEHAPLLLEDQRRVDAKGLAHQWLGDATLAPLAGSPLMLATLLMVHHLDGALPRGRSRVYERYIDGMLGLWDSRWGIISVVTLDTNSKKTLLTHLALHFHLSNSEQMGDSDLEAALQTAPSALLGGYTLPTVLDHLRERSGLLVGPGTWSFVHKSVGEFLVASAIRDGHRVDKSGARLDRLRLFKERYDDRWNAVLFFWAGLASPSDLQSFIEQVIAAGTSQDLEIALGLIHDQLDQDRLSLEWLRLRLPELVRLPIDEPIKVIYGADLMPNDSSFDAEYPIDTSNVRHISSSSPHFTYAYEVLSAVIQRTNLRWSDLRQAHTTQRSGVWLACLNCGAGDAHELASTIAEAPDDLTSASSSLRLAFVYSFDASIRNGILPVADVIAIWQAQYPDIRSIKLIALLGALQITSLTPNRRQECASLLAALDPAEVDPRGLASSSRVHEVESNGSVDLLHRSIERLDDWALDPGLRVSVRAKLETLKQLRDRTTHIRSPG